MNGYGFHWSRCHGDGSGPVMAVAAVVLLAVAVLEWLIARIWWLVGGTVLFLAAVAAVLLAVLRWTERREARFAERRRAEIAAQAAARHAVTAQVIQQASQGTSWPSIAPPQVTFNFYGLAPEQQAAVIRTALPRQPEPEDLA